MVRTRILLPKSIIKCRSSRSRHNLLLISVSTLLVYLLAGAIPATTSAVQNAPDRAVTHVVSTRIALSPEERRYLQKLGPIKISPDPDWVPYEQVDEHGNFTGIAADLLDLLAKRLGIEFTYVLTKNWDESVALSKSGKVHILPFLNQTPVREKWLIFTEPLFTDPNVFVTREEHPFISNLFLLPGESIVLPNGTSIEERIRRDYPKIAVINVGSESEVFQALSDRKADITMRSLAIAAYTIRKNGLFNLKIAGQAPPQYSNNLRIGVLKGEPLLREILNKGIATITPSEQDEIVNRHVNITIVRPMDYGFILKIAAILAAFIGVSLYWNLRLKSSNAALEESERSKSVLLSNLPGMAYRCRFDRDWTIEFISDGCFQLTGYTSDDLVMNKRISFSDLIMPEYRETLWNMWQQAVLTRQPVKLEYRIITADNTEKWVHEQGIPVYNRAGHVQGLEGIIVDITDLKNMEVTLRSLSVAVEQSPVSVVITDLNATIKYVNPQFEVVTGYSAGEAVGQNPKILKSNKTERSVFEDMWRTLKQENVWQGEFINCRKNGELFWEEAYISPVSDTNGVITSYVAVKLDITERKRIEEQVKHMAHHDSLTALPNRNMFSDRLQQSLALAKRESSGIALMFVDLDRFKPVNDTYGHAIGDLLLQEVAKRMRATVRASDTVGRIGGDEFVVVLSKIDNEHPPLQVAEKLRLAMEQLFLLDGHTIHISATIGIALYPEHGLTEQELCQHADMAMYSAKQGGRNRVRFFDPQMLGTSVDPLDAKF